MFNQKMPRVTRKVFGASCCLHTMVARNYCHAIILMPNLQVNNGTVFIFAGQQKAYVALDFLF